MTHVMLDTETWGLTPGSHLRSIGAVVFDPYAGALGDKFYCNIAAAPAYGLTSDEGTRAWWSKQSFHAREAFNRKQLDLSVALVRFSQWFRKAAENPETIRVWAHGPHFDCPIVEAAYRAVKLTVPWHYRAPRDTRTMLEAACMDPVNDFPLVGVEHNALDDAVSQALGVMEAFNRLGIMA